MLYLLLSHCGTCDSVGSARLARVLGGSRLASFLLALVGESDRPTATCATHISVSSLAQQAHRRRLHQSNLMRRHTMRRTGCIVPFVVQTTRACDDRAAPMLCRGHEAMSLHTAGDMAYQKAPAAGGRCCQTAPPVCNGCKREMTRKHLGWACLERQGRLPGQQEMMAAPRGQSTGQRVTEHRVTCPITLPRTVARRPSQTRVR